MTTKPHAEGFLIRHKGKTFGPYSQDDLETAARDGKISARDDIRRAQGGPWTPAHKVRWLLGPRGKRLRAPGAVYRKIVATLLVLAALPIAYFAWQGRQDAPAPPPEKVLDLGVVMAPEPDPATVVSTEEWGLVPPGRVNVRLDDGATREDALRVAEAIDGTLVGESPFIDLYLIDIAASDEAGLRKALGEAAAQDGVLSAFPEQIARLDVEGWPCTPLDDPAYEDFVDRPQEITGVQQAWDILRASGMELAPVRVSVVDDGLYGGQGEFNDGAKIVTPGKYDALDKPLKETDEHGNPTTKDVPYYSHGTGVASVIAADGNDGGVTGIASPLGDKLTLEMANVFRNKFKTKVKPGDKRATVAHYDDGSFVIHDLLTIQKQVEHGAKIVNLSWASEGSEPLNKAYRAFFAKMAKDHPKVVFVCSAGNAGTTPDATKRVPGGIAGPNIITVGNINTQGTLTDTGSNVMAQGSPFEVSLAAPGHEVLHGVDPDGAVVAINGGTSMAAPQVASTIALMKSIDDTLTAKDCKAILQKTARTHVEHYDGTTTPVPAGVGGRCLAVDLALLEAINLKREREQKGRVTAEDLLDLTKMTLEAQEAEPGEWVITASVPRTKDSAPTMLVIRPERAKGIAGATSVTVKAGEVARWTVTEDGAAHVHVKRHDTGACWHVVIGGVVAKIQATPSSGFASAEQPLLVKLTAKGSQSVHGKILHYMWDFDGDGTFDYMSETPEAPQDLTLSQPGTYTVGVQIMDEMGREAEATTTIEVKGPGAADNAARISQLRELLRRERKRKKDYEKRIAFRRANMPPPEPGAPPRPDFDKGDKDFIRNVIVPKIRELEGKLRALGASP